MPEPPLRLADLAAALGGVCLRTARRHLAAAMTADPDLHVARRGRTLLFTRDTIARTVEALAWRCPTAAAGKAASGTRAGRSASVV